MTPMTSTNDKRSDQQFDAMTNDNSNQKKERGCDKLNSDNNSAMEDKRQKSSSRRTAESARAEPQQWHACKPCHLRRLVAKRWESAADCSNRHGVLHLSKLTTSAAGRGW